MSCSLTLFFQEYAQFIERISAKLIIVLMCFYFGGTHIFRINNYNRQTDFFIAICILGCLQIIIAFAQYLHIFHSYNNYFRFTGTFDNPAVLSMILSICASITIYYIFERTAQQKLWIALLLIIIALLIGAKSRCGLISITLSFCIVFAHKKSFSISFMWNKSTFIKSTCILSIIFIIIVFLLLLYFWKKNSADGRWVIWNICLEIISQKVFFGYGEGGFDINYMHQQAIYFSAHPNSHFAYLADNISHPYNEYLLLTIKYGVFVTLLLLSFICFITIKIIRSKMNQKIIYLCIISTILIWSCFSYPYTIPFMWILITFIVLSALFMTNKTIKRNIPFAIITILFAFCMIIANKNTGKEWKWLCLQKRLKEMDTLDILHTYKDLYSALKNNSSFTYNYGAILHSFHKYKKSLEVLKECRKTLNDYNIQMLMAEDYKLIGLKDSALTCLNEASFMIPNRFLPLYHKMEIYKEKKDTTNVINISELIISKKVKDCSSSAVRNIISEAEDAYIDYNSRYFE